MYLLKSVGRKNLVLNTPLFGIGLNLRHFTLTDGNAASQITRAGM